MPNPISGRTWDRDGGKRSQKAFEQQDFLQTREARPIRILSEYLYPQYNFKKEKVTDTVVFFGSARVPPQEDVDSGKFKARNNRLGDYSRYYEMARELAAGITRWSHKHAHPQGRHFFICTGGGGGIMEASNRGASEAGGKSIGLISNCPTNRRPTLIYQKN